MRVRLAVLALAVPAAVYPCGWDRDTLSHEGSRFPEMVQVITGRFERNPPLFYQMRIAREEPEVRAHPDQFAVYDDLGVAYDKLGDDDRALFWMDRKKAAMDASKRTVHPIPSGGKLDPFSDAAYRYYANVGTFRIHRWLRRGGKSAELKDAERARDEIAKAIEINPDAHFGREAVQLHVIKWLIEEPAGNAKDSLSLADYLRLEDEDDRRDSLKVAKGLAGMIVLGNAWESPDMFGALAASLSGWGHGSVPKVGYLAELRMHELVANGHPLRVSKDEFRPTQRVETGDHSWIEGEYRRLRQEAEAWSKDRDEYMLARLQKGQHPDTDPHFWDDYHPSPAPALADPFSYWRLPAWVQIGSVVALILGILLLNDALKRRSARRKATAA